MQNRSRRGAEPKEGDIRWDHYGRYQVFVGGYWRTDDSYGPGVPLSELGRRRKPDRIPPHGERLEDYYRFKNTYRDNAFEKH